MRSADPSNSEQVLTSFLTVDVRSIEMSETAEVRHATQVQYVEPITKLRLLNYVSDRVTESTRICDFVMNKCTYASWKNLIHVSRR
jgi:hypothetical protein